LTKREAGKRKDDFYPNWALSSDCFCVKQNKKTAFVRIFKDKVVFLFSRDFLK